MRDPRMLPAACADRGTTSGILLAMTNTNRDEQGTHGCSSTQSGYRRQAPEGCSLCSLVTRVRASIQNKEERHDQYPRLAYNARRLHIAPGRNVWSTHPSACCPPSLAFPAPQADPTRRVFRLLATQRSDRRSWPKFLRRKK